MRTSKFGEKS